MATGTGKTRTAAAFIKRLFEANAITRVLFLVDRIPLAKQTEDAFAEHLPDYPAYVLRAGRRFQDEKRITITTLQSMVNLYAEYSSGYFDLVISDECHRSIYGQWSGVLKHFDGIQIGLTATPCVQSARGRHRRRRGHAPSCATRCASSRSTHRRSRYKLKDAIRDGYLVPYQIYKAQTVKTAAEGGFEVKRDELDWSAMDDATRERTARSCSATNESDRRSTPRRWSAASPSPSATAPSCASTREVLDKGYVDAQGRRCASRCSARPSCSP